MPKLLSKNYKLIRRKALLIIFFIIFFLVSWIFFTYKITEVPPGINGDEASIGYNAVLVARDGKDLQGRFLPIFVSTSENTDWKQPITFYSTVLAFKIFDPSYSLLREVSVVFVLVSGFLIFLLGKQIFDLKGGFLSLIIFITIPAVLIQSHLALENIAPVPFIILWLLMLKFYQKNLQNEYLYWSALFLGIGLLTYPGMRIIFPVFLLLTLLFLIYLNRLKNFRKKLSAILIFLTVSLIFPILLLLVKNQYPGAILSNNRPHPVQNYQEFLLPYISSFDPSFLFITGDSTPYHSTGRQGVFLLATFPLFVLGLYSIAQKKNPFLTFILFAFFLTPLLYGLSGAMHRGSRLLVMIPMFTIIATLGLIKIIDIKNKYKYLLIFLMVCLIVLNYADFVRDYWYEYPQRIRSEFARPYQLVFERAQYLAKTNNLTAYIHKDLKMQNQTAIDFFELSFFPEKLKIWNEDKGVPARSVIIVPDGMLPDKKNIEQEKIGDYGFGLLINQSNEIR